MLERMNRLTLRSDGRELRRRGSALFPCSAYQTVLSRYAGWEVPWHWHDEIEIKLMLSGTAVTTCGEESILLREGEGLFVNAHVLHHTRGLHGQDCVLGSIVFEVPLLSGAPGSVFETRYIQPVYGSPALPVVHLTGGAPWEERALAGARQAYTACEKEGFGYEWEVLMGLARFWKELGRAEEERLAAPAAGETAVTARMREMLAFLEARFTEDIAPADLAAAAHISLRECFRCFRRVMGIPPAAYLLRRRVSYAAGLLLETELPVTEVALRAGFHSPSYFGRRFREQMGCSPREFRENGREHHPDAPE